MIKLILIIGILILGIGQGLHEQMEYHYEYHGQILTGFPDLKNQVSGVAIRCDLVVQTKSNSTLIVKMSNVEVGDFNGQTECYLRKALNITYHDILHYKQSFEQPFMVFLTDKNRVMSVPAVEPLWISNIRKSVIQHFLIQPLKADLQPPAGKLGLTLKEDSLLGSCNTSYSFELLPTSSTSSSSSSMMLDNNSEQEKTGTWRVVRTVDLDDCSVKVVLQRSSLDSSPDEGSSNGDLQLRSSSSELLMQLQNGSWTLNKVTATGEVTSNLYGTTKFLHRTITNQTLVLKSSQVLKRMFSVQPQQNITTLLFEVWSPFQPPKKPQPKPWIKYGGQIDELIPFSLETMSIHKVISSTEAQLMKDKFLSLLGEVSDALASLPVMSRNKIDQSTVHNSVLEKLTQITNLLENLPEKEVNDIFNTVFKHQRRPTTKLNLKQNLLIDVACASRNEASLLLVLRLIAFERISSGKAATVFMTLSTHISSYMTLDDTFGFVANLPLLKDPFLASVALVSLSNAVRKSCLQNGTQTDLYGNLACDEDNLVSYAHIIVQRFYDVEEPWIKLFCLEAAMQLGPPVFNKFVKKVFTDPEFSNPMFKITLLKALRRHGEQFQKEEKQQFVDILNTLVDGTTEHVKVRQNAIMTSIAWCPDFSWWQKMAQKTYTEKSRDFAAFIYFTVKDMAHTTDPGLVRQATMARSVLPFCKRFSSNYRYPLQYFSSSSVTPDQVEIGRGLFWPPDLLEMVGYFTTSLGGKLENLFGFRWDKTGKGASPKFFERGKTTPRDKSENIGAVILELWDSIEAFLPVSDKTIKAALGEGGNKILRQLHQEGIPIDTTKFFNLAFREVLLPSEVGLPIILKMSVPVLFKNEGHLSIFLPDMADITFQKLWHSLTVDLPYRSNLRLMQKVSSTVDVIVPWNDIVATSGIHNVKEVNLPTEGHLLQNIDEEGVHNMSVTMASIFKKKFPVLYMHNLPYTSLTHLLPQGDYPNVKSFELVTFNNDQTPMYEERLDVPNSFRLHAEVTWKSDLQSRLSKGYFLDYLKNPQDILLVLMSPSPQVLQTYITLDMKNSPSTNFTFAFASGDTDSCVETITQPPPTNLPPQNGDQTPLSLPPKFRLRSEMKKYHLQYTNIFFAFEAMSFGSATSHQALIEAVLSLDKRENIHRKENTLGFLYEMHDTDPLGVVDKKIACLLVNVKSVRVENMTVLMNLLEKGQAEKDIEAIYITQGENCMAGNPSVVIEGNLTLSEERKEDLIIGLSLPCDADPLDPTQELKTDAVYDRGNFLLRGYRNISDHEAKVFKHIYDLFRTFFSPQIDHVYHRDNHADEVSFSLERDIVSPGWTIKGMFPKLKVSIRDLMLPRMMDQIVYPGGFEPPPDPCNDVPELAQSQSQDIYHTGPPQADFGSDKNLKPRKKETCTITPKEFTTFDNRTSEISLTLRCYIIVSKPIGTTIGHPTWLIMVRQKDLEMTHIEVRLMKAYEIIVDINGDGVKVNGRKVKFIENYIRFVDASGKLFCTIFKRKNSFLVSLVNEVQISISTSKLQVELDNRFTNKIDGICGQFVHSKAYLGPQKCLYTDMTLFAYAWTIPRGHWCDYDRYFEEYVQIKDYQLTCKKK